MKPTRFQFGAIRGIFWCVYLLTVFFIAGCSEFEKPITEPFYSQTAPPQRREFRWSNGKMPKSFDPALASAAPETDIVRAIFDGLTETDPKTLKPLPVLAVKWESTDDFKTWIFHLRKDAKWSNGERITARDFVRSWERIVKLGKTVPQRGLFENIVGMDRLGETISPSAELGNEAVKPVAETPSGFVKKSTPTTEPERTNAAVSVEATPSPTPKREIGAVAIDPQTLKVTLIRSDKDFPTLVAHTVFRPVFKDGTEFEAGLNAGIVTSGAFRISSVGQDGVTLDRAENHWDRASVQLERVKFVPIETAETALEAYRLGEIDAVTNAHFEPLALKLLKPFEDFRQTTHGALNLYEFNLKKPPFDDRRVREALSIAIERERLTDGEMEGSTRPAMSFLPFGSGETEKLVEDSAKAKKLLEEAGFPNGANFPTIRLVVNRNDVQQRVARLVAKMWEQELNVKAQVIVVESAQVETIRSIGEFDLIRRGVVLPAADEMTSLLAIFAPPLKPEPVIDPNATPTATPTPPVAGAVPPTEIPATTPAVPDLPAYLLTHKTALAELPAIPLYFPTSYSLVKPYVLGFEINVLDSPSLKDVRIDTGWQPKKTKKES